MNQIIDCISSKRSVRKFTGKQIPYDTVETLLTLGTMASTGSNLQPWGFVVIQDKEEIEALAQAVKSYLLAHLNEYPHFVPYETALKNDNYHVLNHATTLILTYGNSDSHWYVYDCSLATGNIMLAAHGMGIGTCWIGYCETYCNTPEFKAKYNVPESFQLVSTLSCGYEGEPLAPPKRKPPVVFHK
ncbi:MAG: nitroreductase family protein [Oscillospiraceae bacterium]|jgi:nitroreductase